MSYCGAIKRDADQIVAEAYKTCRLDANPRYLDHRCMYHSADPLAEWDRLAMEERKRRTRKRNALNAKRKRDRVGPFVQPVGVEWVVGLTMRQVLALRMVADGAIELHDA